MVSEQRITADVPRRRHLEAYAALVLDGGYVERGASGRWRLESGCVVSHTACEAHDDLLHSAPVWVCNIPLPSGVDLPSAFTVSDPDELRRAAFHAPHEAHRLLRPAHVVQPVNADWPDLLADELRRSAISIGQWAREHGLAPATVSRGFHAAFGVTPARYRAEAQMVRAVGRLLGGIEPLVEVAAACGFADQAHLGRALRAETGRTPREWSDVKTVQDRRLGGS